MKIGILGTGGVGQTLAARLETLKHDVVVGTRDPKATLAKTEKDGMGHDPYSVWAKSHANVKLATFKEAASHGELLINATSGSASMDALKSAGEGIHGKVMMDLSNPLDFSKGFPPSLSVCNTDSLAEQLQKAFPKVLLVKTLNTMSAHLMVQPTELAGGDHCVFVSGNDAGAKIKVTELLKTFGWKQIIDVGDITSARGTEMLLPIWLRLMGQFNTAQFNFKIVK